MFVLSMSASLLTRPNSEFINYTTENSFWSLAMGIAAYISGREIARNIKD